jgi:hypothetical protein
MEFNTVVYKTVHTRTYPQHHYTVPILTFSSYNDVTKAEIRIQLYNKTKNIDIAPRFAFTIIITIIMSILTTTIVMVTLGLFRLHKLMPPKLACIMGFDIQKP